VKKGYIQIYTGNGKGKTTAALGLALRAAGAGLKVHIAQFLKGRDTSEIKSIKKLGKKISIKQYGNPEFIKSKPSAIDVKKAEKALEETASIINMSRHDLVILDEVNVACSLGIISTDQLCAILKERPANVEIVLTGRDAPKKLVQIADLVSEIREVRHYYKKGVKARRGVEF
jgi:cob(I)alamin adenosyltransferase